jgi:sirohydrochlorin cobaltochelatase
MTKSSDKRNGIVLAMFGTSVELALPGLLHIRDRMAARFPQTLVRIAFTSKIICRIWQARAADPGYRIVHPEVPEDILHVQSPETVIGSLQEEGIDSLVIQPVHIAPARKDVDSGSYINGPGAIETGKSGSSPIRRIVLGRPALGSYGTTYPYTDDIVIAVRSLLQDAALARQENGALFYMGHGNKNCATAGVYRELVAEMHRQYPDISIVMNLVEEGPSLDRTIAELKEQNVEKILLKPFMITAGDHVRKDMVSDGPGSQKTRLEDQGFTVVPVFKGLGEEDGFADIFVQHATDAARDGGIELT